jgi:hypothetical protein
MGRAVAKPIIGRKTDHRRLRVWHDRRWVSLRSTHPTLDMIRTSDTLR